MASIVVLISQLRRRISALRPPPQVHAVTARVEIGERQRLCVLVAIPFGGEAGVAFEIERGADAVSVDGERERAAVFEAGEGGVDGEGAAEVGDAAFARFAVFGL